jgi:RelE-like toxin of type II toxin-antitoxin system HigB
VDLVALPTWRYYTPSNRLERLSGDREGQYSIRINDRRRVCFRWRDGDAHDVDIVDYHKEEAMARKRLAPVTSGEVLLEEFIKALGTTQ